VIRTAALVFASVLVITACDGGMPVETRDASAPRDAGAIDAAARDAAARSDGGTTDPTPDAAIQSDAGAPSDAARLDAGPLDAGSPDAGPVVIVEPADAGALDAGATDAGAGVVEPADAGPPDAGPADAGPPDDSPPDAGPPDAGPIDGGPIDAGPAPLPGLSEPCSNGPGWTVWRLHFDGSSNPRIDTWDASCSYSLAPSSACEARVVTSGFGSVGTVMDGYAVELGTSFPYLRVRYSVEGLAFSSATLWVQARSYATASSTNIRAWSPLYGDVAYGPVDNDWTYDWYGIDWSEHLSPDDEPGLTAVQLYAYLGSGSLAVHAVELCVDAP
jgi:hypothetical protein